MAERMHDRIYIFVIICISFNGQVEGKECADVQYQCFDGSCIPLRRFCDGIAHCQDASDELNCTKECLLRHDLFGQDKKFGYHGTRRITREGDKCTTPCRGVDGRMIYCITEKNVTKPCDVPYCSLFTSWTRKTCDFTYSFCDWTILSNSSVESSISQDSTASAEVFINGQNFSYIIISSPVITNANYTDYIQFNITIKKPNNVYWASYIWDQKTKDQDLFPKHIKGWSLDEKSDIIIQNSMRDDPRQKIYAYFFFYGYGEFNITLRLSQISIVDHTESFTSEKCGRDEFRCLSLSSSSSCIPFEFVGDGFEDCEDGNDERVTNTGGYLVIYDVDVIDYDWIVLFLLPSCSVLSVFVRSRLRYDEDRGVQINMVFDVRNSTEYGGTLIILMNVDKENVCSKFEDIGVLITNTESKEVYTSFCVKIIRNVIVADFTEGLNTFGHRTALDISVHEGKRRLVYRYNG